MTAHYFDPNPAVASDPGQVRLRLPGISLTLTTDRGVFAHGQIDRGTRFLLRDSPPPPATGEIVDLGCGYGAIAIVLAQRSPATRVWAVDVNERALGLVRDNASAAGVTNVIATRPEDVPSGLRAAAIYSNPPVRVGKEPLHELLGEWLDRLEDGAEAHLVVQRHLGSDSLARWLEQRGHPVRRAGSKSGYRLLAVHSRVPE